MQLQLHPEYAGVYQKHRDADTLYRHAVAAWQQRGEPLAVAAYDLTWTVAGALTLVQELSRLFQAYNQVLWQHFSYCPSCGGQCCVQDASDVRPFDLIAVALLGESTPTLPARIDAGPHHCIYLAGTQCTWPATWRTIKCWSFYCLGSQLWDAPEQRYRAVTGALQTVVTSHLPSPLCRWEAVQGEQLAAHLEDPVDFSNTLHRALNAIFVTPFQARYAPEALSTPAHQATTASQPRPILLLDQDLITFVMEALATVREGVIPPAPPGVASSPDQLLADLEQLAWIAEGQPSNRVPLLHALYQRYAAAGGVNNQPESTIWQQMHDQLRTLL
ncbi:MAG: hypothetical protein R3C14_06475 [Caldilineaceae bacterium]